MLLNFSPSVFFYYYNIETKDRKYKYFCVARKYFFSLLENVVFNLVLVGIS